MSKRTGERGGFTWITDPEGLVGMEYTIIVRCPACGSRHEILTNQKTAQPRMRSSSRVLPMATISRRVNDTHWLTYSRSASRQDV